MLKKVLSESGIYVTGGEVSVVHAFLSLARCLLACLWDGDDEWYLCKTI